MYICIGSDNEKYSIHWYIWQISWQGLIQCISVLVLMMKNTAFSGIP